MFERIFQRLLRKGGKTVVKTSSVLNNAVKLKIKSWSFAFQNHDPIIRHTVLVTPELL